MDDDDDPSERILAAMARATGLSKSHFLHRACVSYGKGHHNYVDAKEIHLYHLDNLVELPREIRLLRRLVVLGLCAKELERIPREIGQLQRLEELCLRLCLEVVALPNEVFNLTSLKKLFLRGCSALNSLPAGIGQLKQLQVLDLRCCQSLEELPMGIGQLQQLKTLDLSHCKSLKELPDELWRLTNLVELDLSDCRSLTQLSPEIGQLQQLKELDLSRCQKLTKLPIEIGKLSQLEKLLLQNFSESLEQNHSGGLDEFLQVAVSNLVNLTSLDLSYCSELVVLPPEMGLLTKLECLVLHRCKQLTTIPKEILELPSLCFLNLWGCSSLACTPKDIGEASYSVQEVYMPMYDEGRAEMDCYTQMNRAGRHLLRRHDVPAALWPHVLAGRRSDENFILWFLTNNPDFVKTGENKE